MNDLKDSPAYITPAVAAELLDYTTRHIQNMIRKGKISAKREDGKYYIEKSEFFRVFPKAYKRTPEAKMADETMDAEKLEIEIKYLKESAADKDKQIEYLKKQLEETLIKENKLIDTVNSNARLLEYKAAQIQEETTRKSSRWFGRNKKS